MFRFCPCRNTKMLFLFRFYTKTQNCGIKTGKMADTFIDKKGNQRIIKMMIIAPFFLVARKKVLLHEYALSYDNRWL